MKRVLSGIEWDLWGEERMVGRVASTPAVEDKSRRYVIAIEGKLIMRVVCDAPNSSAKAIDIPFSSFTEAALWVSGAIS